MVDLLDMVVVHMALLDMVDLLMVNLLDTVTFLDIVIFLNIPEFFHRV